MEVFSEIRVIPVKVAQLHVTLISLKRVPDDGIS